MKKINFWVIMEISSIKRRVQKMYLFLRDNSGYEHYRQWLVNNFENPDLMQFITTGCAILFMILVIFVAYKVTKE